MAFSVELAMCPMVPKGRTDVALMYNVYNIIRARAAGRPAYVVRIRQALHSLVQASRCMLLTPNRVFLERLYDLRLFVRVWLLIS